LLNKLWEHLVPLEHSRYHPDTRILELCLETVGPQELSSCLLCNLQSVLYITLNVAT